MGLRGHIKYGLFPDRACIDYFQFVRIPFRTTKGIRVEFEKDYRCVNMQGKVYWLDPEEAESVVKLKHKAPKDRCEIYAPRWYDPAVCLTHRLEHRVGYEGTLGWLLNY